MKLKKLQLFIEKYIPILYKCIKSRKKYLIAFNPFISNKYLHLSKGYYLNISKLRKEKLTPNLVLIGAQKGGSTFLHKKLSEHPDIFMSSPVKEPCFFMNDQFFVDHQLELKSKNYILKNEILQGYKGEKIIGESTSGYSAVDFSYKYSIPENMWSFNPKIKIIYLLRNPFERLVSDYMAAIRNGRTKKDLNTAISESDDFLKGSLYYYQIKNYLKYLDTEQIKIAILEEINENPGKVFYSIFEFLGLKNHNIENTNKVNQATNRDRFSKDDLKFKKGIYDYLLKQINEDIAMMEKTIKKSLVFWDLSEETWVSQR